MKVLAQLKLRKKIVSENVFRITRAHKSSEQYILIITRMHSSRMRTARSLTRGVPARGGCVPAQGVPARGVYLWGVYLPEGCTCPGGVPTQGGVYLPRGGTCPGTPPPHCGQNS